MSLEGGKKLLQHGFPMMADGYVPGLVVDSCTNEIELISGNAKYFGDLLLTVNLTVAQADGFYLAVLVAGPRSHGVWIGIIEHDGAGGSYFPDVFAEVQHGGNDTLSIHDSADAERVADTLVNTVFQRYLNISFKPFQSTNADTVNDISGILKGLSAVQGRLNLCCNPICLQIPLA